MRIIFLLLIALSAARPAHAQDHALVALGTGLLASAIFDVETTFAAFDRSGGEANPIMRPFVNAGRVPTYAMKSVAVAGILWGSHHLRSRGRWWWFVPGTAVAVAWTVIGFHNLGIDAPPAGQITITF